MGFKKTNKDQQTIRISKNRILDLAVIVNRTSLWFKYLPRPATVYVRGYIKGISWYTVVGSVV